MTVPAVERARASELPRTRTCIACGADAVELFCDLGVTTLANKFLAPDELGAEEPAFPLRVGFCHACAHVQLMDHVPPDAMFDDYLYVSGASDTLRRHFDELSALLVARHGLGADDLVVDIGSNDASLLAAFRRLGVGTLGVDPAENLASLAREQGIDRYVGYFGRDTAPLITEQWGPASLITATNTFPHIPDLDGFLDGIAHALRPGGAFVVEAHYLLDFIEQGAFDTVYHEHVSYWALRPLVGLCKRKGLDVVRAERLPIHHGQLRATIMHAGEGTLDPSVDALVEAELEAGLDRFETFQAFGRRVAELRTEIRETVARLKAEGKRVAGYGAPAKGNTLLSYLDLGPGDVEYIADRSPMKQGRVTPGTHIPVVDPGRLLRDRPDYVLLLAWNFAEEVLEQQAAYRETGGRFILPVPEVTIV